MKNNGNPNEYEAMHQRIQNLGENPDDKKLYGILTDILSDDNLNKISGIKKNDFITSLPLYYEKNEKFSEKQVASALRTLKVYDNNMHNARKL